MIARVHRCRQRKKWVSAYQRGTENGLSVLPERSRFNRRRRNLFLASDVIRQTLMHYLPKTDVFIVDSFPIAVCDFRRAKFSKYDFKWVDATEKLATYGNCATKNLGTFP